jgi:predicted HAD superfamily Cof-like phosphohydrolase
MIVIEGPDASGKSTLAQYLADALDAPIKPGEGPPKFPGELCQRVKRYRELPPNTIFDRHPVVSEEVYCYALRRSLDLSLEAMQAFYSQHPILIYCDPLLTTLTHHVAKDHDTPEHLLALSENYERLVTAYRNWAFSHAHIIYRIGDDPEQIVRFVTDYTQDIRDFHHKFGIQYQGRPRYLPTDIQDFRIAFMAEELCEYAGVTEVTRRLIQSALVGSEPTGDLEDQFDALIDLVYVALGTAHLHGFQFARGWHRVHAANMTKMRTPAPEDSKRHHSFDVIKPPGFRAPELGDLVRAGSSPCFPCEPPVTDDKETGGTHV